MVTITIIGSDQWSLLLVQKVKLKLLMETRLNQIKWNACIMLGVDSITGLCLE